MRIAFTDIAIHRLKPPEKGQVRYFDTALPGFGLLVGKHTKTFIVVHGRSRRLQTLGRYPSVTLKNARRDAQRILADSTTTKTPTTYPEAVQRFTREKQGSTKTATITRYHYYLDALAFKGNVGDITKADITAKLAVFDGKPRAQNACFSCLRTFLNYIKDMWKDFDAMQGREQRDRTESTLTRLMAFMRDPRIRSCIGQEKNNLRFDRTVLVALREDELGTDNARLLGALILSLLFIHRPDTTLYVDEGNRFPFISQLIPLMPVFFTVQFLAELKRERDSILGSVHNIVAFRTSVPDAELLEPEFNLHENQLYTGLPLLEDFTAYLSVGTRTVPISTIADSHGRTAFADQVRALSLRLSASQANIDRRLRRFF